MRPPHAVGSDGPANLAAAVTAAGHSPLAAYGPVVVHQDEIHAARWVTKLHSTRVAAFASPAAGPVGLVVEDDVVLLLGPPPGADRLSAAAVPVRRIELLWAAAGADGLVVDAIADLVDGLVVAGTGGGHVPPPLAEALVRVVRSGRPVVLASRCASGHVLSATYGGVGSEIQLLADGLVSAGALSPLKARLRLMFGLSAEMRPAELFPKQS
jgi:L-asparaginase